MEEIIEEPAEEFCERNTLEVSESSGANPETTAVITEEVLSERDVINRRGRGRFGGDSRASGGNVASASWTWR